MVKHINEQIALILNILFRRHEVGDSFFFIYYFFLFNIIYSYYKCLLITKVGTYVVYIV